MKNSFKVFSNKKNYHRLEDEKTFSLYRMHHATSIQSQSCLIFLIIAAVKACQPNAAE